MKIVVTYSSFRPVRLWKAVAFTYSKPDLKILLQRVETLFNEDSLNLPFTMSTLFDHHSACGGFFLHLQIGHINFYDSVILRYCPFKN